MTRRRPSFRAYVRRRWRILGLLLVLLCGALLVLVITDRGHDPLWEARGATVDQAVLSPDGSLVYTLVREQGNVSRLEAHRASDGALVWESPMNATRALLRSGDEGVVVATDFPRAFLTAFASDGTPRFSLALEGNPHALALDGKRLALALQARGDPVLVFDDGVPQPTLHFGSLVNALDARAGKLAVGTGSGDVLLVEPNGSVSFNVSLPMSVRTVRLSGDASLLFAGGYSLTPGDLSGSLALLEPGRADPIRWQKPTGVGIGLVALDAAGVRALALEESPPRYQLLMFDAGTGAQRWARTMDGIVPRDDAGAFGAAALSPDGSTVATGSLRGPVGAFDAGSGNPRWSYESEGTSAIAFADHDSDRFVANGRLSTAGDADALFLFSISHEPAAGRFGLVAASLVVACVLAAAAIVGIGYWRVRRTY